MANSEVAGHFIEQLGGELGILEQEINASVYDSVKGNVLVNNSTEMGNGSALLLYYNRLVRYSSDVDIIRRREYFSGKSGGVLAERVQQLDSKLQTLMIKVELEIQRLHEEKIRLNKLKELQELAEKRASGEIANPAENIQSIDESGRVIGDYSAGESLDSLKSRLLSKTGPSQLDEVRTTEAQNNYHESIQQELIDSLPSMVSSLKEQAIQFQEMLKQDAVVLKEATQTFETSHGKFNNVNELLAKYHKEGRLGFWFYIRTIGMVSFAFVFLLIIIRLIPARH